MMRLRRALAAHRPGRLVFSIVTLSVALSGVVANYSLSANALLTLERVLSSGDNDRIVVSARLSDASVITRGRGDAAALPEQLAEGLRHALPPDLPLVTLRRSEATLISGDYSRNVIFYAVGPGFLNMLGARQMTGDLSWPVEQDRCLAGVKLAQEMKLEIDATVQVERTPCRLAGIFQAPDTPPFGQLSAALLVPFAEDSLDPHPPRSVAFLTVAPAGTLSLEDLRGRLGLRFEVSHLRLVSSRANVEEAARLTRLVQIVSNGLGFVIMLVGSASIASLMSFSVAERSREIAVRMTVGATRSQIIGGVLAEAALIGLLAAIAGGAGGIALAGILEEPLSEFFIVGRPLDAPFPMASVLRASGGFVLIAILAALLPALRAAAIDPASVLRQP